MESFEYKDDRQDAVDKLYQYAADLMFTQGKSAAATKQILIDEGLDAESAGIVVENLQGQMKDVRRSRGQRDMLFGALWCVGGIIATAADIGFIFWGAIVFGAFQFIRGITYMG